MISEYWMWATWLTKVILYLSVAFVVGGAFCYFLLRQYLELKESILKYITIGAGLG
ncbi:copper resistance protein CopD, partial [bacterium LRH843]|nr:copper resistance protein CopD [bacterium LRH843]